MTSDHIVIGAGDQDDALSRKPDAIHVDDVVNLIAHGDDRPQLPEPACVIAKRSGIYLQLGLRELS